MTDRTKMNKSRGSGPWTPEETLKLVLLYNRMLDLQRENLLGPKRSAGQISKAVLVRDFIAEHAPERSKGSVECKLMNVSHVRQQNGLAIVEGYKPLSNVSTDLAKLFHGMGGDQ